MHRTCTVLAPCLHCACTVIQTGLFSPFRSRMNVQPACRVLQVIGRGQAVHRLQPDGCTPSVCPLLPAGFPLLHVFIKIHRHNASISQAKLTHFPRKNKPATAASSSLHFFIYRHAFPGKHVLLARKSPPMTYNPASFFKANNSASLIFSRSNLS